MGEGLGGNQLPTIRLRRCPTAADHLTLSQVLALSQVLGLGRLGRLPGPVVLSGAIEGSPFSLSPSAIPVGLARESRVREPAMPSGPSPNSAGRRGVVTGWVLVGGY